MNGILETDAVTFVPGHGGVQAKADLQKRLADETARRNQIKALAAQGKSLDEVRQALGETPSNTPWPNRPQLYRLHRRGICRTDEEVDWYGCGVGKSPILGHKDGAGTGRQCFFPVSPGSACLTLRVCRQMPNGDVRGRVGSRVGQVLGRKFDL